jgi:hypothetical protein
MHTSDSRSPCSISSRQLLHPIHSASQTPASLSKTMSSQTYHSALQGPSETRSSSQSSSSGLINRGSKSSGSDVSLVPAAGSSGSRKAEILPNLLTSTSLPTRAHANIQILNANVSPVRGKKESLVARQSNTISSPRPPIPLRSALHRLHHNDTGKSVQFSTVPQSQLEPVSPSEVLARRPSSAPDTSAGAAVTLLPYRGTNDQGEVLSYEAIIRQGRLASKTLIKIHTVPVHHMLTDWHSTYVGAEIQHEIRECQQVFR